MNTSPSQRSTRIALRPSNSQVSPNSRSASPWTQKSGIFRLSSTGHVDLGPQEEEIERLYNQMKDLMECLNDKLEENAKKKEEMCMIAFRKAMRSIEEDLKDMRQQINIATKTTRDASDEEAAWTIQKQLTFFREESVILSKKLKEAEATIKELKAKNQQLDFDARSEHLLLVKSQKEVRRLKDLLERKDRIAGVDKNQDNHHMMMPMMTDRSKSPNNKSKGKKFEQIESKYKRENIHVNLLRQHLEETLRKKADYLSIDKVDELIDIVADRVNHKFQVQEQQIDTLQSKLLKIKQYYQYVVRRDTGTNLPSGLHDILFIFWDMFSAYKMKPNNNSQIIRSSRSRPTSRSKSPTVNNLSSSPYASTMTLDRVDRSSVMDSIKASNMRYSLFNSEDKIRLIQRTLEDPAVEAVLTYHTDAHKFIRREGQSPVEQLMRIRDQSNYGSMANSRAQTPGSVMDQTNSEEESVGNYQETIRDRDHEYLWNYSRPVTGNKRLNSASGSARKMLQQRPDQNNNSPVSGMEYSHQNSLERSPEKQENPYSLRLESHWNSMVLPPIEDYGSKGELTQVTKEDDENDELIMNNNFGYNPGQIHHHNEEIFEPAEPMEGVGGGGRDFRRKFQVRPSKNASLNEG